MKKRILLILALLSVLCVTMAVVSPVAAKDKVEIEWHELNVGPNTYLPDFKWPNGWPVPFTESTWHDAGVYREGEFEIYADGVLHASGTETFTFYYLNAHLLEGDLGDPASQVWVWTTGGKYELTDGSGVLAYQGSWNAKVIVEGNFPAGVVKSITILRFQTVLQGQAAPYKGETIKTDNLLFGPGGSTIQPGIMLTK